MPTQLMFRGSRDQATEVEKQELTHGVIMKTDANS